MTASELKADWQAAQAAADTAYATHLSASRASAISWGGNSRLKDAAYSAWQSFTVAEGVANLAYVAYLNAKDAAPSAAA